LFFGKNYFFRPAGLIRTAIAAVALISGLGIFGFDGGVKYAAFAKGSLI